ncbi:9671_t:CDS:1, partial [Racocetra persica]
MVRAQFEPLAKLWGVENKKVPELLEREAKLIMIDGKLQQLLKNSYFGGTYIDVKANKININTVDQSKVKEVKNSLQMKEYKNYLRFKKAINSLSQLKSTYVKIDKLIRKFDIINSIISIEHEVNNVVIYLEDKNDQNTKEFIESVKFFKPKIVYSSKKEEGKMVLNSFNSPTLVKKTQINPMVVGGDRIVTWYNNIPFGCSAGFWMKDQDQSDEELLLVAGHCAYPYNDNSPKWFYHYYGDTPVLIGHMENYTLTPNDLGFIRKTNQSHIRAVPNIRNFKFPALANPTYVEYLILGSTKITSTLSHICKSGYVTGISCGHVTSLDASIGSETGDKTGGLLTSAYSVRGDSGGSMFQFRYSNFSIPYVNAVGILASGNLDNTPNNSRTYCEPLNKVFFEYGYSLVHHPLLE